MKIAILASEGAPYAKSGGLGDVMGTDNQIVNFFKTRK